MIRLNSSATETSTCAYGELSIGETIALKTAVKAVLQDKDYRFMRGELVRALSKLEVIEKEADHDERYIGFTVGTKRPDVEFNFDKE